MTVSDKRPRHIVRTGVLPPRPKLKNIERLETLQRIALEREGVTAQEVLALQKSLRLSDVSMQTILGVSRATWVRRTADSGKQTIFNGASGHAAIALTLLREEVRKTTAPWPKGFMPDKWLGRWLQEPLRALGGFAPAKLMTTPTGQQTVRRLYLSHITGAYW